MALLRTIAFLLTMSMWALLPAQDLEQVGRKGGVSLTGGLSAFGALYTTVANKELPESVVALGSTAVGALAGLLAPSPRQR